MKPLLLLLFFPGFIAAQNVQEVVKRGEDVFNRTCATVYCHGPKGIGGGAPRINSRGFDQAFIANTVTRGVRDTAMQSFTGTLTPPELTAVVAYVATLNGIANPTIAAPPPASAAPALSADAQRGRMLFSDSLRSFGRCATCHEVNNIGISIAAPIATVPANAAALKSLATPRVSTVTANGETMPALVIANKSTGLLFYDLTMPPPVLRNELPGNVQIREGSTWRHASVIAAYNDAELSAILSYLQAVISK